MGERAGAAAEGRRRPPRRLRARHAAPRGRLVARPARGVAAPARPAVRRVRAARAEDRHLPLLLRADADPEVDPVPAAAPAAARRASSTTSARTSAASRRPSSRSASARTPRSSARYDAIRWVPEAHVIPPGLDLRPFTPVPPSDAARPLVVHAPSNREKKGTRFVIEACEQLPVEPRHRRGCPARRRARALRARRHRRRPAERRLARRLRARVDGARQASRHLPGTRRRRPQREGYGIRLPVVPATAETLVDALRPLVEQPALRREIGARAARTSSRCTTSTGVADRLVDLYRSCADVPGRPTPLVVPRRSRSERLRGIRQSTGSAASSRGCSRCSCCRSTRAYLGTEGFGKIESVTALVDRARDRLVAGISSAFFRFYFDSKDPERRVLVVRTTFWFTMGMATVGLIIGCAFATPIAHS